MQEISTRYILDSEQQLIAVQIPFDQFQKMVEVLEASGRFVFTPEIDESWEREDIVWMQTDGSHLREYDDYDWQPGELEAGAPLQYVPNVGWVIQE